MVKVATRFQTSKQYSMNDDDDDDDVCSVTGRLRAAVDGRTFSPLLQCCLTVDLLSSYSDP